MGALREIATSFGISVDAKPLDKLGFGDVKSAGKSILDIDRATGMQVGELPGTRAVREWLFGPDKKKADGGDMDAYKAAIAMIESRGSGGYSAIGPVTRTGDRAYGKYQVMGANIPEWSKDATGRSMTPAEFLASPETQEAVFKKQFGKYVEKYGASGAAAAWFGRFSLNQPALPTATRKTARPLPAASPASAAPRWCAPMTIPS